MTDLSEKLTVIVRAAGERTESACSAIVKKQTGNDPDVVHLAPFSEAHIRSMKIALEGKRRWSLLLDADVLLHPQALETMVEEAEQISAPFYMLNFRILDRGFVGPAYGAHLYSTSFLGHALAFQDDARNDQKPETRMCKEMAGVGVPSYLSKQIVGLHGYEQFYSDLYRTAFVRGVKYGSHFDYMLNAYYKRCNNDDDFKVMLWGLLGGRLHKLQQKQASLDIRVYVESSKTTLDVLRIEEKLALGSDLPIDFVDSTINTHTVDSNYLANQEWICPDQIGFVQDTRKTLANRLSKYIKQSKSIINSLIGK